MAPAAGIRVTLLALVVLLATSSVWGEDLCANNKGDCSHTCKSSNNLIQACCLVNGVYVGCNGVEIPLLSGNLGGVIGRKLLTEDSPCVTNSGDCSYTCKDSNNLVQACCLVNGVYVGCNSVRIPLISGNVGGLVG
jgi:hypothetical protein